MTEILVAITTWISALVTPIPLNEQDVYCLTRNAYYEAKGDSQMSQIAVTHVVLNRMNTEGFPKKACDVVYQKNKNPESQRVVCQFSWTCDRKLMGQLPAQEASSWRESLAAVEKALAMYYHRRVDVTEGSTFYHAHYVNPGWRGVEKVTTIGSHIYYRTREKCQNNQTDCTLKNRSRI
jgi:spore germination cell wall hydrolase CwlJ-like protein